MSDTHRWRPTDLEAIRRALRIPVTPGSIRAINEEMQQLETHYPDAIPAARAHLDVIERIDNPPPVAGPELLPQVRKVTRKGAAGPVPDVLPRRKLDVIEYATELLMEEVSTEYAIPTPPSPVPPARLRAAHVRELLLILPRLQSWIPQQPDRFSGPLIRG
ncbi:MAG: hypothetical protein WBN89_12940 [Prochlorococcaceae cyanobacterium]